MLDACHMFAHCLSGGACVSRHRFLCFGRPPSLLPGSRRFSVPRLSVGTMQTLRLPTHPLWLELISPRGPEVPTLFSWTPPVAGWLDEVGDVLIRGRPFPGLVLWCGTGIPCFMVSLLMVCPALRPRPCPRISLGDPRVLFPLSWQRKPSGTSLISWLNHTAFHLAVYASCRHLWRRRKTRLRCGATRFPAVVVPLGRRCGVSGPVTFPSLSHFDLFFCLYHSVLSFLFLFRWHSPPPWLSRRHKRTEPFHQVAAFNLLTRVNFSRPLSHCLNDDLYPLSYPTSAGVRREEMILHACLGIARLLRTLEWIKMSYIAFFDRW